MPLADGGGVGSHEAVGSDVADAVVGSDVADAVVGSDVAGAAVGQAWGAQGHGVDVQREVAATVRTAHLRTTPAHGYGQLWSARGVRTWMV